MFTSKCVSQLDKLIFVLNQEARLKTCAGMEVELHTLKASLDVPNDLLLAKITNLIYFHSYVLHPAVPVTNNM
jgi:hypothetical protein